MFVVPKCLYVIASQRARWRGNPFPDIAENQGAKRRTSNARPYNRIACLTNWNLAGMHITGISEIEEWRVESEDAQKHKIFNFFFMI